ncbi:HGxxPAAW family protein [Nonomuraea sp. NPDC049152]|uniref:HGxxPAAW family protein n=1 Tax=Nonomuraea sp. NPDC049152 TaxID=3154350 RepID=UPI0033ED2CAE
MTARHDHGNTPAAWTAVTIILIGSFAGGLGLVLGSGLGFYGGLGLMAGGAAIGKVMQMVGLGKQHA